MEEKSTTPHMTEENSFGISAEQLEAMFNYDDIVATKGVASLEAVQGVQGLLQKLQSSESSGIMLNEKLISYRISAFGANSYIEKLLKSFC